ncbi:MAG: hypothetical protein Q8P24_04610 [Desulfobacterales bacterium]|nr:hypothetical protein [Desulfobacterales bacterium]
MPLYKILPDGQTLDKVDRSDFLNEQELHSLIEKNLPNVLGIRLIASEFSIPNGRKVETETTQEALKKAIFDLHGCKSKWLESAPVKETFEGEAVWEGTVQVFELIDHPTAKKAYAWSYLVDDSGQRKFFAVLHQGPINSAVNAVKASIVSEK